VTATTVRRVPAPPLALRGDVGPVDGAAWQRIRRYAVPAWMIERATERRLAGDWRGACATAAVDVRFDPDALAARYGSAFARALAEDLRHLAPDLLRWHLPRHLGGRTTLAPGRRILLARYGTGPDAPCLSVTTGSMQDGPQRLGLHCVPLDPEERLRYYGHGFRVEDWTTARFFWDARHTAELRTHFGGGPDRLPFLRADGTPLGEDELADVDAVAAGPAGHAERVALLQTGGRVAEAYAAAGMEWDLTVPPTPRYGRPVDPESVLTGMDIDLTRLAAGVRGLAAAGAGDRFRFATYYQNIALTPSGPGPRDPVRVSVIERDEAQRVPLLPRYLAGRLPDLDLLRTGRITPGELHPLVAEALFPGSGPVAGPPGPDGGGPVRVRCRGDWHEVRLRDGVLDLPHTAEEQQRERAMRAFGGAVAGCFAVQQAWGGGEGRLPRALRARQRELFLRIQHGDTPAVTALLDAGFDPRVRDRRGHGLLHELHLLDHELLLPRLLAAGLDLEAKDKAGRTPLQTAVYCGGSADLVRALLDAGARIDVVDDMELSLSQTIRRYQRTDLDFLRKRVDEECPGIGAEWWDEYMADRAEFADDEEADA
jgi:hypothetical protein